MAWLSIGLLLIGFAVLIKGADLLVDGGSSLAKRLGLSELVIGLTIVSFGTSSPELVVNLLAAASGTTDLAIGNIIGSNIANTLLILGVSAVIFPLAVQFSTIWREIPLSLVASFAVFFLVNDRVLDGAEYSAVTRIDGLVLLLLFLIFLYYTYGISRARGEIDDPEIVRRSTVRAILMVLSGVAGLVLGGKWIVDNAVTLAATAGISQATIGLSVVAIGTSLPELATSAVAAWRRNSDIAVGNVVGSNIFNLLMVLAVTSIVRPLPISPGLNIDMAVMIGSALLLFTAMFIGLRHRLDRWQGVGLLVLYALYLGQLAWRG